MAGERADAIPEAATMHAYRCKRCGVLTTDRYGRGDKCAITPGDNQHRDYHDLESVRLGVVWPAAAAPLLSGGGEAERLRSLLREVAEWIDYMERPGPLAQESRRKIAEVLDAHPDAERAPQGLCCYAAMVAHADPCPWHGSRPVPSPGAERAPEGDEAREGGTWGTGDLR